MSRLPAFPCPALFDSLSHSSILAARKSLSALLCLCVTACASQSNYENRRFFRRSASLSRANLFQVDAVLKMHGIDDEAKLGRVPPQTLGRWLGVDAVVYGKVIHYEPFYALLVSGWILGADVTMVSTHNGEQLFCATSDRYDVDFAPAFDTLDIAINPCLTILELRDMVLARNEEEDAREIILRIPRSKLLEAQLIEEATRGEVRFTDDWPDKDQELARGIPQGE